ncbi:MAG: putative pyruvate, phosphate dikinase [Streblomastix strix]|uniref:Putative pyruvate, phosphate dikinase n=1 Tax=Streblomastix strix TaxID=222440 RepID=A0A5J4WQ35_9EUKA|nr:MAG: putative pyruvate, phosphate dikinase [Streblomastix strix]
MSTGSSNTISHLHVIESSAELNKEAANAEMNDITVLTFQGQISFYSMMSKRVRKVLFVGNEYDFFQVDSCFMNSEFTTCPDFLYAKPEDYKTKIDRNESFDVIITMHSSNDSESWHQIREMKEWFPKSKIFPLIQEYNIEQVIFSSELQIRMFLWNGDPMLFLALIKLEEDEMNKEEDVVKGQVKAILYVEDSIQFYSEYIPMIYNELINRTKDVQGISLKHTLARRRARPKLFFASCLYMRIQDWNQEIDAKGCLRNDAIRYANCIFAQKNTGTVLSSLKYFFDRFLMLTSQFVPLQPNNGCQPIQQIQPAWNHRELREIIEQIPPESILYHAYSSNFSNWLFQRGEFGIAIFLQRYSVKQFKHDAEQIRQFLLVSLYKYAHGHIRGISVDFDPQLLYEPQFFMTVGYGNIGGKAHGLLFLDRLIAEAFITSGRFKETTSGECLCDFLLTQQVFLLLG